MLTSQIVSYSCNHQKVQMCHKEIGAELGSSFEKIKLEQWMVALFQIQEMRMLEFNCKVWNLSLT